MSFRHRLRRIEDAVGANDRNRPRREIYLWEPTNSLATAFVLEQTFNVHWRDRRHTIQVVGEPPRSVYNKLARELLPAPETLKKMTDAQILTCQEKYLSATITALNTSRQKQGLPSVFV